MVTFLGFHLKPGSTTAVAGLLSAVMLLSGCSSLLPRGRSESTPFKTFEDARNAIEGLVPMQSRASELSQMGIDPVQLPNTEILTHTDVIRRFLPSGSIKREDLDPGVVTCLEARDACRGWVITAARIERKRIGGFLADFTNFSRRTETTGWRFNAMVLLLNDIVVYRNWGGQPRVNDVEVQTNPLGPLQELGPALVTSN